MHVSYIAAFLGGVLSLLSPCSVMAIPMFAAAMSRRAGSLFQIIVAFGAGLFLSLIPFAIGALALSRLLSLHRMAVSMSVGVVLVLVGLLLLVGKHLPLIDLSAWVQRLSGKRTGLASIFVLGLASGLGSSACIGPILGAIMSLASTANNTWQSFSLMFVYAMGLMIPLILASIVYERHQVGHFTRLRASQVRLGWYQLPTTTFMTALLLIGIGYVFVRHQGSLGFSYVFVHTDLLDTIFSLQEKLLY